MFVHVKWTIASKIRTASGPHLFEFVAAESGSQTQPDLLASAGISPFD